MTVVVDTSVLTAAINEDDERHEAGQALLGRILQGEFGVPVSSEHVLDEGLTLLRRRPGRRDASHDFAAYFFGHEDEAPPLQLLLTSRDDLVRAHDLHFRHYERGLSFTDCLLAVMAQDLKAVVASFDNGFDGLVPRVS